MKSFTLKKASVFDIAAMVSLALSTNTFAQENSAEDESKGIEQITVTAQKRAENLQETPLAITAFSGDELREAGVSSLADIASGKTPGLVFSAFSVGQPEIAIRGIGTKEDGAAASDSTIISVDGVYIAARTAQVFDIFDLERVEVIRGPQGTLYGKNSIGGSINFVTSKPTDDLTGRFRTTFGNFGRFDVGGVVSGGLSDELKGKFSFSSRNYDGHITNVHSGRVQDTRDTLAWRGQLVWEPTSDVEVIFTYDGADDELGDSNREPVGSAGTATGDNADNPLAVAEAFGTAGSPFLAANDEIGFTFREVEGYSAQVNWTINDYTVTSVTSYRESEFDWLEDSEGLPGLTTFDQTVGPEFGFRRDVSDSAIENTNQFTQEIRILSPSNETVEWVAGAFFSEESINRTETFCIPNCGTTVLDVDFPEGAERIANRFIINSSLQENDSTSLAAYGQGTYRFNNELSLTAGVRYSFEEKDVIFGGDIDDGVVPAGVFIQENFLVDSSDSWENVSGRLALDWKASRNTLYYGSISTGFKSGGFIGSPSTPTRATDSFDEETAINYEIGFKSTLLDNTLRFNAALFFTDYKDLQVTRFAQLADNPTNPFGEFITENAASAEISGLEIEWDWFATDNLQFGGSYSYLDATSNDFTPEVANLAPEGGCPEGSAQATDNLADGCIPDFSGNVLRQAPEHSANLFSRYFYDLGDAGLLRANVSFSFQDSTFFDPDNNDITVIPAYAVWDAQVSWIDISEQWTITAWVKNLTDKEYRTHVFSQRNSQIAFATFAPPRTIGLSIEYSFY
jgi:iron complex outermembrane receptor protein